MRTTLDLPDPLMRELKTRAAMNGQSLKSLLNDLIQRALYLPASAELAKPSAQALPVLQRLQGQDLSAGDAPPHSNAQLSELDLQEDLEKLRRSGFIQ